MAETSLPVTPGSGATVAGYTDTNSNFRQTITIGDPTSNVALVPNGMLLSTDAGTATLAIASAKTSVTVVKSIGGNLCRVLITASNTGSIALYDNAATSTGTIIGAVPASAPIGNIYSFQMPAALGITAGGSASAPGYTVSFA